MTEMTVSVVRVGLARIRTYAEAAPMVRTTAVKRDIDGCMSTVESKALDYG